MDRSASSISAAIAGIGYSRSAAVPGGFSRRSGESVLTLVLRAVKQACADAGITPAQIDGAVTYERSDSVTPQEVLCALGSPPLAFDINQAGGGGYPAQSVLHAALAVEHGLATYCLVYRAMNGRSGVRMGEYGSATAGLRAAGPDQFTKPYGMSGPAALYALGARRWMERYGVESVGLGEFAVRSRAHAVNNPRAHMRTPITLDDHQNSRWIVEPYHLLDCCQESDVACAVLVTTTERARQEARNPVAILSGIAGLGRFTDLADTAFKQAGRTLLDGAGIQLGDIDLAMLYDNFSDCPLRMIEDLGWCGHGESVDFVRENHTTLDGRIPMQTSGGMLNEGYCHGFNNALEAVQQLRGEAEDLCPGWGSGVHTFDRSICRQVRDPQIALHTGSLGKSAMILGRM